MPASQSFVWTLHRSKINMVIALNHSMAMILAHTLSVYRKRGSLLFSQSNSSAAQHVAFKA